MTEWWVSQKKHFCDYCKVWTGGHLWQISKHEEGRMHKEKKELKLTTVRQNEKDKTKNEKDLRESLVAIERAAAAAMGLEMPTDEAMTEFLGKEPDTGAPKGSRPIDKRLDKFFGEDEALMTVEQHLEAKRKRMGEVKKVYSSSSSKDPGKSEKETALTALAAVGAPAAPPSNSPWTVVTDPATDHVYYYNQTTGVSSWEKPADFGLDLSAPPPPPKEKKPPPPPAKKKQDTEGIAGGWEEVKPQDSMWDRPEEQKAAQEFREDRDSDEEMANPLGNLKAELMGRRGTWATEDLEKHEKETFQKSSLSKGNASFPIKAKKASGIRKRERDDD
ncbi:unnamed protein product [Polarella glacialis]|uniref:WW domain-containing protein n=1 Tax=Polarella glacialis TaxID=89957 RepID=A0A813E1Y7_POLGL|nr:unnamed protein product [Polarella glacialis]